MGEEPGAAEASGGGGLAGAAPGSGRPLEEGVPEAEEGVPEADEDEEVPLVEDSEGEFEEVQVAQVCGRSFRIRRKRSDFFAACAGDLPSTGLVLWECSELLGDYLAYAMWLPEALEAAKRPWFNWNVPATVIPSRFWKGKRVLELGAGCGLVSIALASLGAEVLCTDGDADVVAAAARNARLVRREDEAEWARHNGRRGAAPEWGRLDFAVLKWGDAGSLRAVLSSGGGGSGPLHFLVGSDLLYGGRAPPGPLVETVSQLALEERSKDAEAMIAVKNRGRDEVAAFSDLLRPKGLWAIQLAERDLLLDGFAEQKDYNIMHLTRASRPAEGGESPAKKLRT